MQMAARDGISLLESLEYLSPEYEAILEWVAFIVFEPVEAKPHIEKFYEVMKNVRV